MGLVNGNPPPWFAVDETGDPGWGLANSPFRELGYADCPICRTGGDDPDNSATFVDAVLPTVGGEPGLRALFEGANIDIQFDYSYINNPDWTEEWDYCIEQTSPTRKSVFHAEHQINLDGETSGTISLPTLNTGDSDLFGPFPPFQLGGITSASDDRDRRWGRGFVWKQMLNHPVLTALTITEQTSRHEQTQNTLVANCTTPGVTVPTDPDDADDDYDIIGAARIYNAYFRVCRTVEGDYKMSLLAVGGININGRFPGSIVGQFLGQIEFFIYTGAWDDALPFFNLVFRDPEFHNGIDLTEPLPDDYTLSDEAELASEIFGATVNWRHTKFSHIYNTHETAVAGTCAGMSDGSTTAKKITLNEGESTLDISNMIVTVSPL